MTLDPQKICSGLCFEKSPCSEGLSFSAMSKIKVKGPLNTEEGKKKKKKRKRLLNTAICDFEDGVCGNMDHRRFLTFADYQRIRRFKIRKRERPVAESTVSYYLRTMAWRYEKSKLTSDKRQEDRAAEELAQNKNV